VLRLETRAGGWRAYLGGGYGMGKFEVGIYCPDCAKREFGSWVHEGAAGRLADEL
jgi:hypothetical protein